MTNVIIYLVASIGAGVQVYAAVTGNLWWAPNYPFPTVGLVGVIIMGLGTAWSAVKGSSAAWIFFIGALLCWAFYIPGLGTLLGGMRESISEGRLSIASSEVYLSLLPPALLAVGTIAALLNGPMAQGED
jgi:hypothetical protein